MFPRSAEAELLSRMRRDAVTVMVAPDLIVTPKAPRPAPSVSVPRPPTKVCACCEKPKPLSTYRPWPGGPEGLASRCNTCATKARRERQRARQAAEVPP